MDAPKFVVSITHGPNVNSFIYRWTNALDYSTTSPEYKIGTMTVVVLLIYSELYMHTVLLI